VTTEQPPTEYQVTFWRDLPSMVVARAGDDVAKAPLAGRLQAAIDEAAMRLGETGSEDYLAGWARGPWTGAEGSPAEVLEQVRADLEQQWPARRLTGYLDDLGPRKAQP
jgi:hypothetical protein